ncbi:MAG: hypothetical protein PHF21_04350 [Bacilli bacterium]|nr:hypothetical protein [Bacilli bacterium]
MNKKTITRILITLLFALIYFYIVLPPLNFQSFSFLMFILITMMVYIGSGVVNILDIKRIFNKRININFKPTGLIVISMILIVLLPMIINFILSPIFFAKSYSRRITVDESHEFINDVKQVDFSKFPLIDKDSSTKLGDRVMGQMPEMVSQFNVSNLYTQINYKEEIIRVTPLEYSGFIKYLTNKNTGVKGYIKVNSVTGNAELIKLDKGMNYLDSAYFSKDLNRKLRFSYPTFIFDTKSFEIDNEGNPYWIVPVVKYIGVELRKEIKGVVVLNAIKGDSTYYEIGKVPSWIDHVYPSSLILEQLDDWGKFKKGFFNSIIGQKNVIATTEGYNYLVMNDDVYLYTGITSVLADEANIGFVLTNLRTKETRYYSVPGAEEYSAMSSAEGQVQQMKYKATFPLLINLNNKPTYLISLKDNAGLVKMYAFVDVHDYQKVVVTDASLGIEKAAENYIGGNLNLDESKLQTIKITISSINMVVIDGNSYYYIVDTNGNKYKTNIKTSKDKLPFLKTNDSIEIYYKEKKEVTDISVIK